MLVTLLLCIFSSEHLTQQLFKLLINHLTNFDETPQV